MQIYEGTKSSRLPPQGSNLQSSGSKSDMLAVYTRGQFAVSAGVEPTIYWFRAKYVAITPRDNITFLRVSQFFSNYFFINISTNFGSNSFTNAFHMHCPFSVENGILFITNSKFSHIFKLLCFCVIMHVFAPMC